MIIDFERFQLGVRPHKDQLMEDMYDLTLDSRPSGYHEVKEAQQRATKLVGLLGKSQILVSQAAFFASNLGGDDRQFAEQLLEEASGWGEAERDAVNNGMGRRIGGGFNPEVESSRSWREMERVDELARLGQEVCVIHYPILSVTWAWEGWNVEFGEVNGVEAVPGELNGSKITVDRLSGSDELDKKYRPDMRVYWRKEVGGRSEWGGREFFALGIIRTF